MNVRAWFDRYKADAGIALALFLFALLLRIPNLYLIPTWADDMNESQYALRVAHGIHSPFLGMVGYMGPIHTDLLALVLKIYQDPHVPRALNLVLASLTVPATFLFGRSLHNRAAGILAAVLLATSSTHIVVNSHYAYSSATTPFFTTLACVALLAAYKKSNIWLLGLAGVLMALAMQTHPVAVAMVPGMILWFWTYREHWSWFRRPALYAAGLLAFLAYAPVLYGIFINPLGFRSSIRSRTYAIETNPSIESYLGNLQNLIVEIVRMVGAHYVGESRPLVYLTDPFVLAYVLLVPAAAIVAVRHKRTLPVWALASSAAIIPYYLYQYDVFPYFTRYVAFLLPLIYVLVGSLGVQVWNRISTQPPFGSRAAGQLARVAAILILAALVVIPLQRTGYYYDGRESVEATNAHFLEIARRVEMEPDLPILLDESLGAGEFVGGGHLRRAFSTWFRFENRPFRRVTLPDTQQAEICSSDRAYLIAATSVIPLLPEDCSIVLLLEYDISTRTGRPRLEYGLYEVGPESNSQ